MANEYDLTRAFKRIENRMIDSMMRNLDRHRAEELEEGFNWEQWQAVQLRELEKFRLENQYLFEGDFGDINEQITAMFYETAEDAQTAEEAKILDQIRKGNFKPKNVKAGVEGEFFGVNEGRLKALVTATQADFTRAEHAILRKANDEYRKIIYDAQIYATAGGTYEQAVDMATKDFLKNGIQSIVYKNGSRHNITEYASMAIRTGNKRAYLMGEGNAHDKYGVHTVRVNNRTDACPLCVKWLGRVLVDDVYGGGTPKEAEEQHVPLLSQAMAEGFLHPNCRDVYSMYIEGVSRPAKPWSKEEIEEITEKYNTDQQISHAEDMADSYGRMAKYSLDPDNKARYQARADEWQNRVDELNESKNVVTPTEKYSSSITKAGKTIAVKNKGLAGTTTSQKAQPLWDMKLVQNVDDISAHIAYVKKNAPDTGDPLLKVLYQNGMIVADKQVAKLKAEGATFGKTAPIYKKKKAFQKELDIINVKEEVSVLQTEVDAIKATMPDNETFNGLWKNPVTLEDWETKKGIQLQGKYDYYTEKLNHWKNEKAGVYTEAEISEKIKHYEDKLAQTAEFDKKGQLWYNTNGELKLKQAELDGKKQELDNLLNPKKTAKNAVDKDYRQRMNAVTLNTDPWKSDRELRTLSGEAWSRATKAERRSAYDYTAGSGKFNHVLYSKMPLDADTGYGNWGESIRRFTDMINKAPVLESDMMFRRGAGWGEIVGITGIDRNTLNSMSLEDLRKALIGKGGRINNFYSTSPTEGHGFGAKECEFRIFAPKGTKGVYSEPFSHYGLGDKLEWNGKAKQSSIGYEQEYIFQRGGWYEVVDVDKEPNGVVRITYIHHPEKGYDTYGQ